jgi:hypothetical protein
MPHLREASIDMSKARELALKALAASPETRRAPAKKSSLPQNQWFWPAAAKEEYWKVYRFIKEWNYKNGYQHSPALAKECADIAIRQVWEG